MKTSKILFFSCLIVSTLLFSCSGEDGEQGIQGEDGEQGIQGEIGPQGGQGPQGEQGENGNANVTKLEFDITQADGGAISIEVPEFTTEALQNHVLLVYLEVSELEKSSFYHLPGTIIGLDIRLEYQYTEGLFGLIAYNIDGTPTAFPEWAENISAILHIAMVEINSDSMAGKNSATNNLKSAGIDVANYHEVMEFYGLE